MPLLEAVDGVVARGLIAEAELGPWLTRTLRDFAASAWVTRVSTE